MTDFDARIADFRDRLSLAEAMQDDQASVNAKLSLAADFIELLSEARAAAVADAVAARRSLAIVSKLGEDVRTEIARKPYEPGGCLLLLSKPELVIVRDLLAAAGHDLLALRVTAYIEAYDLMGAAFKNALGRPEVKAP